MAIAEQKDAEQKVAEQKHNAADSYGGQRAMRVVIVARRYWPHGDSETARSAIRLAHCLHNESPTRGGDVSSQSTDRRLNVRVLTPKFRGGGRDTRLVHRGIAVQRLIAPPKSQWTTGRYIRQWTAWLCEHCRDADVLIAVGARDEAVAAVDAARSLGKPVIVWPTFSLCESDIGHWRVAANSRRYVSSIRRANLVLANDSVGRRTLVSEGIPEERTITMPMLWPIVPEPHDQLDRESARRILAAANTDLGADEDQCVVATTAGMIRGGPIEAFCKSLMAVNASFPSTRFWILGDGPARTRLHNGLRGDGLRSVVAMPGTFNFSGDLMAAADVFVHLDEEPSTGWLADAIVAACHLVIRRSKRNAELIQSLGDHSRPAAFWCDADPVSIKDAVKRAIRAVENHSPLTRRGNSSTDRQSSAWVEMVRSVRLESKR